ncbi:hypothetical protein CR513_04936, partial [Mucuna pruriens]
MIMLDNGEIESKGSSDDEMPPLDVVPMHAGHLLLGCPWQLDRKVTHDGCQNRYTLTMNKRIIILMPLKLVEAYFDQIRIARKCKLREEQLNIQEKERKENMSENKKKKEKHEIECSEEKSKKMSAFAKTREVESVLSAKEKLLVLLYKDEFTDVFPNEVPHGLPPLRGIEHQIDLILGCPIPNRPAYRTNPEETKEIQKQVNELLQKGFVRESLSPCFVHVIMVPKKDEIWPMCVDSRGISVDEEQVKAIKEWPTLKNTNE